MNKSKNSVLRTAIKLALLPVVILLWMIGWTLSFNDSKAFTSKVSSINSSLNYKPSFNDENEQKETEIKILA